MMPKYTLEDFYAGRPQRIQQIIKTLIVDTESRRRLPERGVVGQKFTELGLNLSEIANLELRDLDALYVTMSAPPIESQSQNPHLSSNSTSEQNATPSVVLEQEQARSRYTAYEKAWTLFSTVDVMHMNALIQKIPACVGQETTSVTSDQLWRWAVDLKSIRNLWEHFQSLRFSDEQRQFFLKHTSTLFSKVQEICTPETRLPDLQNLLLQKGLELRGERGGDPMFSMGSLATIQQLLKLRREEMIAWHVSTRCGEKLKQQNPLFLEVYPNVVSEVFAQLCHLPEAQNVMQEPHDSEAYQQHLNQLCEAVRRRLENFAEVPLIQTLLDDILPDLKKAITVYDRFRPTLGQKADPSKIRGMIYGDSWALSFNSESEPWASGSEKDLKAMGYPVELANVSVAGRETEEGVHHLADELDAFKPDFIVISLGGNDAYWGRSTFVVLRNLFALLRICREKYPEMQVIFGLGVPETFTKAGKGYTESIQSIVECFQGAPFGRSNEITELLREDWKALLIANPPVMACSIPNLVLAKENIGADGIHAKDVTLLRNLCVSMVKPVIERLMQSRGIRPMVSADVVQMGSAGVVEMDPARIAAAREAAEALKASSNGGLILSGTTQSKTSESTETKEVSPIAVNDGAATGAKLA